MKFNKISAIAAAVAAVAVMSMSVSAADWSMASYADDAPETNCVTGFDADGVNFAQIEDGAVSKVRLTISDILENPDDATKIYNGTYDITYSGLSVFTGTEVGWLGGGCYCATTNSTGFGLSPVDYDENGAPIWDDVQTVTDDFKYLLPSSVPADASGEFVFMDWSGQNLKSAGVTMRISNIHFYDKDGNELAQKACGAEEAAPAVEEVAVEEAAPAVEEVAVEETAPAADAAPASDTATTSTDTGNASAAAIASVMAVAAAAAVVSKKRN